MSRTMTIGQLAQQGAVNVETVRYYQRRGLLPEPARSPGQARRYGEGEVERLRFIRRAQAMGFTLQEIDRLLDLRARPTCPETRLLVANRLASVERRLQELTVHRDELRDWVADCDANTDSGCCPSLERL